MENVNRMVGIKQILANFWTVIHAWGRTNFVGNETKGEANGVAELDENGKVPMSQLDPTILRRIEITQAEYEKLTEDELNSNIEWIVTDASDDSENAQGLYTKGEVNALIASLQKQIDDLKNGTVS